MSTTWIISRHPGAIDWLNLKGVNGKLLDHLDIECVAPGDTVIGTLPVNLASRVCEKGAAYWHLSLELPRKWRGCELTPDQMEAFGATLTAYQVQPIV
ncbi:CRISPR-associated protein Csx16 [Halomonas sp. GFAJ-1]|uniref:CRISPR-associated protein Csx16 n=1 Tax=Halomonas sp. GFAJ-1 TaxID=1118153 RepID=UPI00023A33C6|nr:CRISPR-associated protein Csx16 [Halomonas sp. GFAJ-1]AVI62975.1 putative CRISPR-associated protein [Halomonas sp. GFAJ-1]EHK60282.1 CRISPR-associated protein VVA1548 family [Halomonas sp. GFAJ-1]